jgi:hypothetical protein
VAVGDAIGVTVGGGGVADGSGGANRLQAARHNAAATVPVTRSRRRFLG